jgi:hypothetical protein
MPESARILFNNAGGEKDLQIIKGGDHLFLKTGLGERVAALTKEWMEKTLGQKQQPE